MTEVLDSMSRGYCLPEEFSIVLLNCLVNTPDRAGVRRGVNGVHGFGVYQQQFREIVGLKSIDRNRKAFGQV